MVLEGGARLQFVHVPPLPIGEQVAAVEESCRIFNPTGIGTVRDPVVTPRGMRLYQAAEESRSLCFCCAPMLLISPTRKRC
jgi:hypothetical protein